MTYIFLARPTRGRGPADTPGFRQKEETAWRGAGPVSLHRGGFTTRARYRDGSQVAPEGTPRHFSPFSAEADSIVSVALSLWYGSRRARSPLATPRLFVVLGLSSPAEAGA